VRRRDLLTGLGAAWLVGGCASDPKPAPELLVRPEWRTGDRWVFRRTGTAGMTTVSIHEVIEATPTGYVMRMTRLGQEILRHWTRDLHLSHQTAGGRPLNRFDPPAMFFSWPLALGKMWEQEFQYEDGKADGRYVNRWRIGPKVEPTDVIAARFGALKIERFGEGDELLNTYWWVPQVRYWVRLTDHVNRYSEELIEADARPA
jgi:hypothetical protein